MSAPSTFYPDTGTLIYRGRWLDHINKRLILHIVVEDGVTAISGKSGRRGGAFQRCCNLQTIKIPDSVTTIRDYAFAYCSLLKNIKIPQHCTFIGFYAFLGCTSLESIHIPAKVSFVGIQAMESCRSLILCHIPDNCSVSTAVFYKCKALESLAIKSNCSVEEYCRRQWRNVRSFSKFRYTLLLSYKALDYRRFTNLSSLGNDVDIDKRDILWVLYDMVGSDDVRRNILEYLDWRWVDFGSINWSKKIVMNERDYSNVNNDEDGNIVEIVNNGEDGDIVEIFDSVEDASDDNGTEDEGEDNESEDGNEIESNEDIDGCARSSTPLIDEPTISSSNPIMIKVMFLMSAIVLAFAAKKIE